MNNLECVKIKEAFQNLIMSFTGNNRFNLYQFIKENSNKPIDNNPVVWNLKGKPNKNE